MGVYLMLLLCLFLHTCMCGRVVLSDADGTITFSGSLKEKQEWLVSPSVSGDVRVTFNVEYSSQYYFLRIYDGSDADTLYQDWNNNGYAQYGTARWLAGTGRSILVSLAAPSNNYNSQGTVRLTLQYKTVKSLDCTTVHKITDASNSTDYNIIYPSRATTCAWLFSVDDGSKMLVSVKYNSGAGGSYVSGAAFDGSSDSAPPLVNRAQQATQQYNSYENVYMGGTTTAPPSLYSKQLAFESSASVMLFQLNFPAPNNNYGNNYEYDYNYANSKANVFAPITYFSFNLAHNSSECEAGGCVVERGLDIKEMKLSGPEQWIRSDYATMVFSANATKQTVEYDKNLSITQVTYPLEEFAKLGFYRTIKMYYQLSSSFKLVARTLLNKDGSASFDLVLQKR